MKRASRHQEVYNRHLLIRLQTSVLSPTVILGPMQRPSEVRFLPLPHGNDGGTINVIPTPLACFCSIYHYIDNSGDSNCKRIGTLLWICLIFEQLAVTNTSKFIVIGLSTLTQIMDENGLKTDRLGQFNFMVHIISSVSCCFFCIGDPKEDLVAVLNLTILP